MLPGFDLTCILTLHQTPNGRWLPVHAFAVEKLEASKKRKRGELEELRKRVKAECKRVRAGCVDD